MGMLQKMRNVVFSWCLWGSVMVFLASCQHVNTNREDGLHALTESQLSLAEYSGWKPLDETEAEALAKRLSPKAQGLASWKDLDRAVRGSLEYASKFAPEAIAVEDPTLILTWGNVRDALERLLGLLPFLDNNPLLLAQEFYWYRLGPDPAFTGYYEPQIEASWIQTEQYSHPLYALPKDVKRGVPYYDRRAIDIDGALQGRGLELAWIKDPVDAFFLQVQGSGRLHFTDGSVKHVLYNGKNNRAYVSLGRAMKERGLLEPDNVSMRSIREYLAAHPEERDELLCLNPSYVFFRLSDAGPYGAMQKALTPFVSLAVDRKVLALGSVLVYALPYPGEVGNDKRTLQGGNGVLFGVGVAQDTGGAIKGKRVDFFAGAGPEAEYLSGHLDSPGAVFLLQKK